jgi:DNA-binding response OmpR family regulator
MTGSRSRILVVEDDEPIAAVLVNGLTLAGYDVEAVADAETARDRLDEMAATDGASGPSCAAIVLDVMLPGQDGIAFCAALRAGGDQTPVLLLTARDEPGIRIAGSAAGASAMLAKPFAYAELLALLGRLTGGR